MDICKEQMRNVPFNSSIFQILHFGRGQETPERTYRNCLLQLNQKIDALQACKFRRERTDIDIEEIKDKLKTANGFERKRLEIDLHEKQFQLENEKKLIEDAIIEVNTYKYILKSLPEFTREEFEKAEPGYWKERLLADARREIISNGYVGKDTIMSLEQIGFDVGKNEKGQFAFQDKSVLNKGDKINDILCLNQTNKL